MPATEELRVILRTVADTSGARQTQQALQQTERQIVATGQRVQKALSFKDVAGAAGIGTSAAQVFQQAIQAGTAAVGEAVNASREHERVIRATGMAYGQAAGQFQEFAQQLSATTGFTSDAILEAALSARTLSQNYGLTIQQTQKLISVSADLARVRGIGVAESFERIQSAIRGEAEASEYLGLTLNDTYLTNQAMNGSLKNTFGTMTDVQKAQVRYNELLKQSQQFAGLAAGSTDTLDGAFTRAESSGRKLQIVLGDMAKPAVVTGLKGAAEAADLLARALERGAAVKLLLPGALGGAIPAAAQERALDEQRKKTQDAELKRLRAINDIGPRAGEAEAERARQAAERAKADQQLRRLRDINVLPTRDNAAELARVALMDQLQAAIQDVVTAQDRQVDLQKQSVQLSAEEARIRLGLLPAQQQMAALQRDITEQQLRAQLASQPQRDALEDLRYAQDTARLAAQTQTALAEAQIRARQAALPATEALDDLRYAQEKARLTIEDRKASADERRQARRELRELGRAEPGVARAALEATREVTLQGRPAERANLEQQLKDLADQAAVAAAQLALIQAEEPLRAAQRAGEQVDIAAQLQSILEQRALAPVLDAQQQNQLQEAIATAVVQGQQDVLRQMLEQQKQPIMLSVNITHEDGRVETYTELIEANAQAQIPPVIQISAVRRN